MTVLRAILSLGLVAVLAACSGGAPVTRTAPFEGAAATPRVALTPSQYRVVDVNVVVPRTLSVSEDNSLFPRADIVWRGDPFGDRYLQLSALLEDSVRRGASGLNGSTGVVLDVELARFHALTERARYTIGGNHDIDFYLTVRDASSGAILQPRRLVRADLRAYGGNQAIEADRRGETQKVRITAHLAEVIQGELTGAQVARR